MMHLRGLAFFLLCLAGGARRSMRINDSHQDAQQNNVRTNGLEVSAEAREVLIPGGSGTGALRHAGKRAGALGKASEFRVAPSLGFGSQHARDTRMADVPVPERTVGPRMMASPPDEPAGTDEPRRTIAVFGGTGGTGSEVVYQALQRGHSVVTLARNPSKMTMPEGSGGASAGKPLTNESLTVFQGSVTNKADVDKVFEGQDVDGVVVALGGKTKDVGPTMLQDGTANIIAACKANGVKRISVVTTIGAGDSMDQAPWSFRLLMMTVMSSIMADKNAQEDVIRGAGADLEWCIVRPGGLKSGSPTGIVTAGKDQEAGAINRADVAAFCLDAVLEPDFKFLNQAVSISSNMGSGFKSVLSDKTKSRMR